MVASLLLTQQFSIEIDKYGKIYPGGEIKLSTKKEIPFLRYRFESYGTSEIAYIKRMMANFKNSGHLVEVTLGKHTADEQIALAQITGLAMYIYVEVLDEDVEAAMNTPGSFDRLRNLVTNHLSNEIQPERIMLKDESTTLHTITLDRIKAGLKDLNIAINKDIGVCSSPLSFDGGACLTATLARDISSRYCSSPDIALPSSNHECMEGCGCIRYIEIRNNLVVPAGAVNSASSKKKKPSSKENNGEESTGEETKGNKSRAQGKKPIPRMF